MILIYLFLSLSSETEFEFRKLSFAVGHCRLPYRQWPATADKAIGSGLRRNSVSELKLKNRCTGSTIDKMCCLEICTKHQLKQMNL